MDLPTNQKKQQEFEKDCDYQNRSPDEQHEDRPSAYLTQRISGGHHGYFVYLLAILSSISFLMFGYDTGVVSGSMVLIRSQFQLNDLWHEVIVSGTIAMAWIFSLIGGPLADHLGRKPVIVLASVLFVLGSVVMAAAGSEVPLLLGRLVVGVGIGLSSTAAGVYVSEISPSGIRGTLLTAAASFITLGALVASLICGAFSQVHEGWRYMLGFAVVPSAIQLLVFPFMPETPRFLISKGKDEEALAVLQRIRPPLSPVLEEYRIIKNDYLKQNSLIASNYVDNRQSSFVAMALEVRSVRRALLVGCCLQLFQQLSGVNTVVYYSASIITMAGVRDPSTAIWLSSVVNLLSYLFKLVGMALVERTGRRRLLLWSTLGSALSLLLLAAGFQVSDIRSPGVTFDEGSPVCLYDTCSSCVEDTACGFCFMSGFSAAVNGSCAELLPFNGSSAAVGRCEDPGGQLLLAPDWCPSNYAWLPIAGMFLYISAFSPGLGAMPWTINAEIYPLWARSRCNAIATSVNWLFNLVVSLSFLSLTSAITKQGTFYLFFGLCALGLAVFYLTVPETKGLSLEDMEELFDAISVRDRIRNNHISHRSLKDDDNAR